MKKAILTGLAALVISCGDKATEPIFIEVPSPPDTIYVNQQEEEEKYSFTFFISSESLGSDYWRAIARGDIWNEGNEDIIGLKPHLKLYDSQENLDDDNYFLDVYGDMGDLKYVGTTRTVVNKTDTLKVDESLYHLAQADISTSVQAAWYRFEFATPDSNRPIPKRTLEAITGEIKL